MGHNGLRSAVVIIPDQSSTVSVGWEGAIPISQMPSAILGKCPDEPR